MTMSLRAALCCLAVFACAPLPLDRRPGGPEDPNALESRWTPPPDTLAASPKAIAPPEQPRPGATEAPDGGMPGMNMPGMEMPGMSMPGMSMPGMSMPGMRMGGAMHHAADAGSNAKTRSKHRPSADAGTEMPMDMGGMRMPGTKSGGGAR